MSYVFLVFIMTNIIFLILNVIKLMELKKSLDEVYKMELRNYSRSGAWRRDDETEV